MHDRPTSDIIVCVLATQPTVAASQGTAPAPAPSDGAALAKQLSNPIASLISLPLQVNYDDGSPCWCNDQTPHVG